MPFKLLIKRFWSNSCIILKYIVIFQVKGMNVVTEFVKFDDEDRGNIDYEGGECPYGIHRAEKDHMFFLCYYTPEKQNGSLVSGMKKKPSCVLFYKYSFIATSVLCDECDSCMTRELCQISEVK